MLKSSLSLKKKKKERNDSSNDGKGRSFGWALIEAVRRGTVPSFQIRLTYKHKTGLSQQGIKHCS